MPVPYATMSDPQSLNLYSYVWNNPLVRIDPNGHKCDWCKDTWEKYDNYKAGNGWNTNAQLQAQQQTYQHQPTQQANVPVTVSDVKANTPLAILPFRWGLTNQ